MREIGNNVRNQSEVARLVRQLDEERVALWNGMYGLSEVGRHKHIHARYQHMGEIADRLAQHVGVDEAMRMLSRAADGE